MSLPWGRMTIAHLVAMIAIIAFGLIPLNHPTRFWLGALIYLKFSVVVIAAFLARYGKSKDWWFGFAVFGSDYILFCVPGLWYEVRGQAPPQGEWDYFDLSGSAGAFLARLKGSEPRPQAFEYGDEYAAILRFWATLAMAFIGGFISLMAASCRRPKSPPIG